MSLKNEIVKQAPGIFSGLGIVGFISAVIMAARVAPEAENILYTLESKAHAAQYGEGAFPIESYDIQVSFLDKVKAVAPVYAPTAATVLISMACIIVSNHTYRNRYASLLALYSISEAAIGKWQGAALDEIGPKRFDKVKERVFGATSEIPDEMLLNDEESIFFDYWSGRFFNARSVETIRGAINRVNEDLLIEDFVCLNDFYDLLELPRVGLGDEVGWHLEDGLAELRFEAYLKGERAYITMLFDVGPRKY